MKSSRRAWTAGAVVGALVLGYALGRSTQPKPVVDQADDDAAAISPVPAEPDGSAARKAAGEPGPTKAEPDAALKEEPIPLRTVPVRAASGFRADPRKTLKAAFRSPNNIERFLAMADVLENLDASNIHLAIEAFENLPHRESNYREMNMLLEAWSSFDGPGAIAWVEKLAKTNPRIRYEAQQTVLRNWAAYDGPSAMAWFSRAAEDNPRMLNWGSRGPLSGWASTDPDAALAWATKHATDEENYLLIGVVEGMATHDPDRATKVMETLPYSRARGRAMDILATTYLRQGHIASERWAESIEDDRLRGGVVDRVAEGIVREDAEEATRWALSLAAKQDRVRAIEEVAEFKARYAPEETADWAMSLEDESVRQAALESTIQRWAHRDTGDVAEWLSRYPASPELDGSVEIMVEHLQNRNPETALNWALSITDEETRHRLVQGIMTEWTKRDPEAARRALNP